MKIIQEQIGVELGEEFEVKICPNEWVKVHFAKDEDTNTIRVRHISGAFLYSLTTSLILGEIEWRRIYKENPHLTERDRKYIKALKALGVRYIAQDENKTVYGYITYIKPQKFTSAWKVSIGTPIINISYLKSSFGTSWNDAEPLDLNELDI